MPVTVKAIQDKKKKGDKISVLTAYDFPFAKIVDQCGIDIVLVGDSLGMVVLGDESTVSVTMRDMMHHTRAVTKAVKNALVVADMPFGSYDQEERALRNALRLVKQAGAQAVKLEGGSQVQKQIEKLVQAGVPVMGHLGMTPQTASQLGGYRVQGRDKKEAEEILQDAILLDQLGVFAIVLECVPLALAKTVSEKVSCPTIGIGAGPHTDGQVLVIHDMLGFKGTVQPKFVRQYSKVESQIERAVSSYIRDVKEEKFPSREESF